MDNFLEQFNDINTEQTFVQTEVEKHKPLAIIAYLIPILFFLPIVAGDKNSTYCKFHANQSLTWLLVAVVLGILSCIPIVGYIIWLLEIAIIIVMIIGAVKGKAYRLPLVGNLIKAF